MAGFNTLMRMILVVTSLWQPAQGVTNLNIMISLDQLPILHPSWSPETWTLVDIHWISSLANFP